MFLSAKCPVNKQEQRWIEGSLLWLADQFGLQVLRESAVILPTEDYFPDPYNGTKECVQAVLDRVCQYMHVDPEKLELHISTSGLCTAPRALLACTVLHHPIWASLSSESKPLSWQILLR
jgi:hypothetical protein